jgi:uncharacterized ferritin-like protein (DUF455 family)
MPTPGTQRLHELAEVCLFEPSIETKLAVTDRLAALLMEDAIDFTSDTPIRSASEVSFPEHPIRVDPRNLPRRSLNSAAGRVAFLHALAHIEFTAIQLAWDMAYRFRGMPADFYRDWLQVAIEEARHFKALRAQLRILGSDYGMLPAHRGLWELAESTADDVLHRLALVPRFMEARGLDVTPAMIAKLEQLGDRASVEILEMIYREEIGHVAIGSRWFGYVCEQRGIQSEQVYFSLIDHYLAGEIRGPFNHDARRLAGFSEGELERLEQRDSGQVSPLGRAR